MKIITDIMNIMKKPANSNIKTENDSSIRLAALISERERNIANSIIESNIDPDEMELKLYIPKRCI